MNEKLPHIEIEPMMFGDYRVQVWDENLNSMLDREYFCRGYASAHTTALECRTLPGFEKFPIYLRNGDDLILRDEIKEDEEVADASV